MIEMFTRYPDARDSVSGLVDDIEASADELWWRSEHALRRGNVRLARELRRRAARMIVDAERIESDLRR